MTIFVNFKDVCEHVHRTMEHVMSFFKADISVSMHGKQYD
jgi:hypothetical protein